MYLDLLKTALLGDLEESSKLVEKERSSKPVARALQYALARRGLVIAQRVSEDRQKRIEGRIWPLSAVTMIGRARLDNIQNCLERVVADDVPGDVIETGVWRGGASIFMRAVLTAYGESSRRVWVADSFEGLPAPDPRYPADASGTFHLQPALAVSLDDVRANFERFGLLGDNVRFLKGWFADTLPTTKSEKWSLIRLDGDMYQSTMDALENLYPNLSVGGWVIIDDYDILACRQAVADYRAAHGIVDEIRTVDWTGVFWRRSR